MIIKYQLLRINEITYRKDCKTIRICQVSSNIPFKPPNCNASRHTQHDSYDHLLEPRLDIGIAAELSNMIHDSKQFQAWTEYNVAQNLLLSLSLLEYTE